MNKSQNKGEAKPGVRDPQEYGVPIGASIKHNLKNAKYRKHYLVYKVRNDIAFMIRHLRESENMTQKQLAAKIGVPQSTVARLESLEDKRIPGLDLLVRLFDALKSRAFLEIVPPSQTHEEKREIVLV